MPKLYTVAEVAEIMKINKNSVYDLINEGKLPVLKIGSLKIREESLVEFLEKNEVKIEED